jgi:hypothetical protein
MEKEKIKLGLYMLKHCKHGCGSTDLAPQRRECYKCRSENIRKRKPVDMCYYWLKKSAKKRHYEFSITLDWFREWVKQNGYMEGRGRTADGLTVDRIRNEEGYTPDNLQVLTKSDNSSKYWNLDIEKELGPQYDKEIPW